MRTTLTTIALGALSIVAAFVPALALDYEGTPVFSSRALDEWLGIEAGVEPDSARLVEALPALLARYGAEGYLDAVLELKRRGDTFVLEVRPGPRIAIGGRRLSGVPASSAPEVADALEEPEGRLFDERRLLEELTNVAETLADAGYPFAEAKATDFSRSGDALFYQLRVDAGRTVRVDSLHVTGLGVTRPETVRRLARFRPGGPFRGRQLVDIRDRLRRSALFETVSDVSLRLTEDEAKAVYEVAVEEAPTTLLQGVIGVGGVSQELTGLVHAEILNLFGTARTFLAHWEGRGEGRQFYQLRYHEPWIAGWPLSVTGEFRQDQEDTLFTRTEWIGEIAYAVSDRFWLRGGWESDETVTPGAFVTRTERTGSRFGIRWDSTDSFADPRRGTILDVTGTRGDQKEFESDGSKVTRTVTTLEARSSVHVPLARRFGLLFDLTGLLRDAPGEELRAETLFSVGGVQSLRGYEERRFRTGLAAVASVEARRFLRRDGSRAILFADLAYLDPARTLGAGGDPWKIGLGVGFRVKSRVGMVGVDLAASEEIGSYGDVRLHMSVRGRY